MPERSSRDKVATQHQLIESLLRGLATAVASRDAERAGTRHASLSRALDAHFVLEEEHYFPRLREKRPDLAAALDALAEEHAEMRRMLAELTDALGAGAWDEAARGATALERCFHGHEETERGVLAA